MALPEEMVTTQQAVQELHKLRIIFEQHAPDTLPVTALVYGKYGDPSLLQFYRELRNSTHREYGITITDNAHIAKKMHISPLKPDIFMYVLAPKNTPFVIDPLAVSDMKDLANKNLEKATEEFYARSKKGRTADISILVTPQGMPSQLVRTISIFFPIVVSDP